MNLTIDYQHAVGPVGQAAAVEVIAAAVRVGHTVTLTEPSPTRHTFTLDDGCVVVTGEHPNGAATAPADWAEVIAATATRLI
jgi:hypothetical protein